MPRDMRLQAEVLQAINDNRVDDVKYIMQSRMRKLKEKSNFPLACVMDNSDSDKINKEYEGAVLAAARLTDKSILKFMINKGLNVNFTSSLPAGSAESKVSPLHVAVTKGLYGNVCLLLEANADVNRKDHKGRTPLHLAVKSSDCEAVRMLLCRGAQVDVSDKQGLTPLQIASKYGHVELVRVLLEHNAQVFQESQKGPSPLHIAAMEGHVPLIDLFSRYVDINVKVPCTSDNKEKAAVHLASERGLVETVRFMVERFGADINILDSDKQTPLHCAFLKKHDYRRMRHKEDFDALVDLFLRKGINLDQQNAQGNTAIHLAAKNQFHKAVEMMLMSCANPELKNKDGRAAKDVVPDFDIPMKQLFLKYAAFSSPYIRQRGKPPIMPVPGTPLMVRPCNSPVMDTPYGSVPNNPSAPFIEP